jgi:MSHA biogenesis protein MshM
MVRLSLKNNSDIKSRITFSKQLKPLTDEDLMKFIQRESDAVKLPKNSFEDGALELIP